MYQFIGNLISYQYQIIDHLGTGTTGAVYRAINQLTGETLALKRVTLSEKQDQFDPRTKMDEDTIDPQDTLRLKLAEEFKILAGLRHPNIINVIDFGFDKERQPFFTMSLLEDAKHLPAAGSGQDFKTQVGYLIQALQAIAYLHRRGIVHRDIKPGNVLVADNRVCVLDFGLSIERETIQQRVGTVIYMAPETIRSGHTTIASDLYAVGTLAYEMWSGQHPFDTGSKRLLMDILTKTPDVSILPEPVRPIVARLLAKDPVERYVNAEEAIQALSNAIGSPAPEESPAIRESFLQAAKFVGRETELGRLTDALEQAINGKGSSWLVGGESGVGKSRLLDELRTLTQVSGATVLRGQAVEGGGQPYELWRTILRHLVMIIELSDLEAGVIKPVVPDIHTLLKRTIANAPELDVQASQQRLHLTIVEICRRASEKTSPLVLLLEDLHWSSESLEPLRVLIQLTAKLPLLVIGSYNSEERFDLPTEFPNIHMLSLGRLSPESVVSLSVSMLGAAGKKEQVLELLQKETEGNAFFLVETVRALAEEAGRLNEVGGMILPKEVFAGGVQRIIRHRLERVPKEHHPLLNLAAVAGRTLNLDILQAAKPQVDIETWLTICANVAVLEVQDGSWHFAHNKLRETMVSGLKSDECSSLHRLLAQAYESVYPDNPSYAAALTDHWDGAGEQQKTIEYARTAGEYAATQFVNDEAVRLFSRALALTPEHNQAERYEIYQEREKIYDRLGERESQAADLEHLTNLVNTPDQHASVALRYGAYHINLGSYEAAIQVSERAYHWAEENDDREKQAQALINTARAFQGLSNFEKAAIYYRQAFELAQTTAAKVHTAQAWSGLGEVAFQQGDYPDATQYHQQALVMQREINDQLGQIDSMRNLGRVANAQGDFNAAQEHYLGALQMIREMGDRPYEGRLLLDIGVSDARQGSYQQAEDSFQQSLTLAQNTADSRTVMSSLQNLGNLAAQQGLFDKAIDYWNLSIAIAQEIGDRAGEGSSLNNLGIVAEGKGEYDKAISFYEQSLAIKREIGDRYGLSGTLSNLGLIATRQGQYDKAIGYFEQSLVISHEIGNRVGESMTLHNLGFLAYSNNQYDKAIDYYVQSLAIKHEIGSRDIASITLTHLGAVALAQLEFQQAQSYYQQAFTIHKELHQPNYLIEDIAGLALVSLEQGDFKVAAEYAEQLLEHWSTNPTFEGAEQPIRTFHFTWQTCKALGLSQADDVLVAAVRVMQIYLDDHPGSETALVYLQQPHHQALWKAWQSRQVLGGNRLEIKTNENA